MIIILTVTLINKNDLEIRYDDMVHKMNCYWKKIESLNVSMSNNGLLDNNLLDKPLDKKNRIAIITYENRKNLKYIELHNKNIAKYCKKWGYHYLFYDKCEHNIYWCKMYLVLNALNTGKYDYVMWLDSDTIIKNSNMSLDLIVNMYSSDIYVTIDNGKSIYNAGVFIIKNSPIGISYMEDCIKQYNKKCLDATNNKLKGEWAGMCYEQGVMNELIFKKYYINTTCLPKYIVYNKNIDKTMKTCTVNTFILHLYASAEDLRTECFLRFV